MLYKVMEADKHLNADIAAQLGLHGEICKSQVKVINETVATFEAAPVELRLRSMNGQVNIERQLKQEQYLMLQQRKMGYH